MNDRMSSIVHACLVLKVSAILIYYFSRHIINYCNYHYIVTKNILDNYHVYDDSDIHTHEHKYAQMDCLTNCSSLLVE